MSRLIAEVLLGLFRSWEFLFITGALIVFLPIVFSVASRDFNKPKPERPLVREKNRPIKGSGDEDEASED
jgi:hypothetical protein